MPAKAGTHASRSAPYTPSQLLQTPFDVEGVLDRILAWVPTCVGMTVEFAASIPGYGAQCRDDKVRGRSRGRDGTALDRVPKMCATLDAILPSRKFWTAHEMAR